MGAVEGVWLCLQTRLDICFTFFSLFSGPLTWIFWKQHEASSPSPWVEEQEDIKPFFFFFKVYYFPHALNVRYKFVEEHANFSSFHEQFHEFPLELAVATLSRTNFKNTSLLYDFYETVNMVGLQTFRLSVSTNIDKCLTWACELHKTGQKVSTKENCLVKTDLFFYHGRSVRDQDVLGTLLITSFATAYVSNSMQ